MSDSASQPIDKFLERYESGRIPWDHELPPPEVMEAVAALPAGRALDLGCGLGRASIYLAGLGWQVDGVDFVGIAVAEARRRAATADLAVNFHVGSVTELGFLAPPIDFALDVGCMHSLDDAGLTAYRDELLRLLRPGSLFMLFAHLTDETAEPDPESKRKLTEAQVHALFAPGFTCQRIEHGETQVEDKPPWPSAWFWWVKK